MRRVFRPLLPLFLVLVSTGGLLTPRLLERIGAAQRLELGELARVSATDVEPWRQSMYEFAAACWSGHDQLAMKPSGPRPRLVLEFHVPRTGRYDIGLLGTTAPDYGAGTIRIDDLAQTPFDAFAGTVTCKTFAAFDAVSLRRGAHRLSIEITGKAPESGAMQAGFDVLTITSVGLGAWSPTVEGLGRLAAVASLGALGFLCVRRLRRWLSAPSAAPAYARAPAPGPRELGARSPSLMLVSAALCVGGACLVSRAPLLGHLLIGCGAVLGAAATRLPAQGPWEPDGQAAGSAWIPLLGLLPLGAATLIRAGPGTPGPVFWLWLVGLGFLCATICGSRLRRPDLAVARSRDLPALAVVVGLSAVANLWRLADLPGAVHGDAAEIALRALALDVPRGAFTATDWWGLPGLHHAVARLGFLFADGLTGARLTDAVLGIVANVLVYLTVRRLGGRLAGLVTACLAAGSAAMVTTWRAGLALGPPVLLGIAAIWALLEAMETTHSPRDLFLLAGVCAGLGVQVNLAGRMVPLLLTVFVAHELAFGNAASRRRIVPGFLWLCTTASLVAGPLLVHYARHPEVAMPRADRFLFGPEALAQMRSVYRTDSIGRIVLEQVMRGLGAFHYYPDAASGGFYVSDGGFLEPLSAGLALLGAGVALRGIRHRRLGWPLLGCLASALVLGALTLGPPAYHRLALGAPFALLLAGIAVAVVLDAARRAAARFGRDADERRRHGRAAAWVLATLLAGTGVAWGLSRYFLDYCQREWGASQVTRIARRIAAEPAASSHTYLLGLPQFYFGYGTIRLLARGHAGSDVTAETILPDPGHLPAETNLFIAVPGRVEELRRIAALFSGGRWEDHFLPGSPSTLDFSVLRVRRASPPH